VEAAHPPDAPERLVAFVDRVVLFLARLAENPAVGTEDERLLLKQAAAEFAELQAEQVRRDVLTGDQETFLPAGFSLRQTEFKLAVAERALEEAEERSAAGWVSPSRVWRALGKVRIVLGSLKGISKWVEALDELVAMAAEMAKNRLGPKLGE
jgi:hypothetical protein